jgi:hypothetical protein
MLSRLVLAFMLGVAVLPLVGWCYFRFGYVPVATASSPMPFEKRLAHMALNERISKEAPKNAPIQASDANYEARRPPLQRELRRVPRLTGSIANSDF